MINIIVACDRNKLIGHKGKLPWKIEKDWNYFLNKTKDGILIMGRVCFEDFESYAASREVIVLSKAHSGSFKNAHRCYSLIEALRLARKSKKEIWICGGKKVYQEAMPIADRLYITLIDSNFEGDVFFPDWQETFPREISCIESQENKIKLKFLILSKK